MRFLLYFFAFLVALWLVLGLVKCGLDLYITVAEMDEAGRLILEKFFLTSDTISSKRNRLTALGRYPLEDDCSYSG